MMERLYKILKEYESPTTTVYEGVQKTEKDWQKIFPDLFDGDCDIKKDWFEFVEEPKFNFNEVRHLAVNFAINCEKGYKGSFDDWYNGISSDWKKIANKTEY